MIDVNIRRLSLPKITYSKYCAKCGFCIKAEWNPNDGDKHGIIDVQCCKNGGNCDSDINDRCPHGIEWNVCLGDETVKFDPKDWKSNRFDSSIFPSPEEESEETLEEAIMRQENKERGYEQRKL